MGERQLVRGEWIYWCAGQGCAHDWTKTFSSKNDSNFRNNSGPQTHGGLCDDFGLITDSLTTTIGHTTIKCSDSDRERRRNSNADMSPGGVAGPPCLWIQNGGIPVALQVRIYQLSICCDPRTLQDKNLSNYESPPFHEVLTSHSTFVGEYGGILTPTCINLAIESRNYFHLSQGIPWLAAWLPFEGCAERISWDFCRWLESEWCVSLIRPLHFLKPNWASSQCRCQLDE